MKIFLIGLMSVIASTNTFAQQAVATTPSTSAGGFFQVLLGLIVVLALMATIAWSLKKFGVSKLTGNAIVRIVGGVSVGNRERVLVVEVGDQWIVVGVAPGQVNALSTMPKQVNTTASESVAVTKNFSSWLKQTIDKRNGNSLKNSQ